MQTYEVSLRNLKKPREGKTITIEGWGVDHAKGLAERDYPGFKGIVAVLINERKGKLKLKKLKNFPRKELIKFCRGMARMVKANFKTSEAIGFYAANLRDAQVKKVLTDIITAVETGEEPYRAFELTGNFDSTFVGLIRAGTNSGKLGEAFDQIAHRLKTESVFGNKIRKAIAVPLGIMVFMSCVFVGSQLKLIPMVEKMLSDVNMEPDTFSKIVFGMSHLTKILWIPTVIGLTVGIILIIKKSSLQQQLLSLVMSKWRLLKELVMGLRQMRMLGTFHMLYANQIQQEEALSITAKVMKSTPMGKEIEEVLRRVKQGVSLNEAMRRYTSCDDQVSHLIAIGEQTGSLADQLEVLTTMYEEQVTDQMDEFTEKVNLITLVTAVLLIGFVFIGAYVPIVMMGPRLLQSAGK